MRNYSYSIFLFITFLIGGFLHVVLWGVDYTTCIVQIFYGAVLVLYLLRFYIHIIDRRIRNIMMGIAALGILYFTFQMCLYSFFEAYPKILLYLWYGYYIPMIGIPVLFYFLARCLRRDPDDKLTRREYGPLVPAGILILGFMTNNLHNLAFYPTAGKSLDIHEYHYGPLYFLYPAVIGILFIISFYTILRKCRLSAAKRQSYIPMLILGIGVVSLVATALNLQPKISGISVWRLAEFYMYMVIGFLEGCIQIGLIPSNDGYRRFFQSMKMPIRIESMDHKACFESGEALVENETTQIHKMKIPGGTASWASNMESIYSLNQEILETTSQYESRNQYLKTENSIKEEQTALNIRNRIYDNIHTIIEPQLSEIQTLLADKEGQFDRNLSQIAVLDAYIKRRSNLELLKESRSVLSVNELFFSIKETMDYLQLCGITTAVNASAEGEFPAEMLIQMYELFEIVVERCMETMSAMNAVLKNEGQMLILRLMLQAESYSLDTQPVLSDSRFDKNVSIAKDGDDTVIVISMKERKVH